MSRTQKEKLETCTDISLQLPKISTEESVVVAADAINVSSEKRKKDADKPLYLKRI